MSEQQEFITKLTEISVVQISEECGNEGMRKSSLNTLTEVVQRFIQEIGSTASSFANASGRTQCNYFDIEAALNEIGYDIEELVKFENNSYPLQTPIDIENLEISNYKNRNKKQEKNNDDLDTDYEAIKIDELEESIANNKFTSNGTVIFDSQRNILEILDKQTANKNKRKLKNKAKGGGSKSGKRMKHIPVFCPDYPDNLWYKHTPIYYKGISHYEQDDDDNDKNIKIKQQQKTEDNKEKTRKCLIKNSNIFSKYQMEGKDERNNNKLKDMNGGIIGRAPPHKKQKLNNGQGKGKRNNNDKMENDDEEEDDGIIENPYTNY